MPMPWRHIFEGMPVFHKDGFLAIFVLILKDSRTGIPRENVYAEKVPSNKWAVLFYSVWFVLYLKPY